MLSGVPGAVGPETSSDAAALAASISASSSKIVAAAWGGAHSKTLKLAFTRLPKPRSTNCESLLPMNFPEVGAVHNPSGRVDLSSSSTWVPVFTFGIE